MSRANDIVNYQKIDISKIGNSLSHLIKTRDTNFFDAFAKSYGTKKICKIVNSKPFDLYSISPNPNFEVVDRISRHMMSKLSGRHYINTILFSPYYYTKFAMDSDINMMTENHISVAYNTLVDNKAVNIKHQFSFEEIKKLIENGSVVLLGIKEKKMNDASNLNELVKIDINEFVSQDNNYLTNHILPTVVYAENQNIMQNKQHFEKRYPNFLQELAKVDIQITKSVLSHELENQQIVLNGILENGQKKFVALAMEYQSKAAKIQNYIKQNQNLLNALEPQKTQFGYENLNQNTFESVSNIHTKTGFENKFEK